MNARRTAIAFAAAVLIATPASLAQETQTVTVTVLVGPSPSPGPSTSPGSTSSPTPTTSSNGGGTAGTGTNVLGSVDGRGGGDNLPKTGIEILRLALIALSLVLAGMLLLIVAREVRRSSAEQPTA